MTPPTSTDAGSTPFWDRLRGVFSRNARRDAFEEPSPHRGMAISLSILISSLLWFTFTMQETYTVVLQLPTAVTNLPENQALTSLPPPTVRVTVEGEGWTLLQLYANRPPIPISAAAEQVNLEDAMAGTELPKNVRAVGVSPRLITLQKEDRIERRVPIRLRADIQPVDTHDLLDAPDIAPDSVTVAGAESIVEGIEYWPTVGGTFDDVRDSLVVRIPLADTLADLVSRSVESALVTAVARQFTEATREVVVTVTGEPSTQSLVTLVPSTVRVVYRVLFSQYNESKQAPDFFATVSYDEIRSDTTGRVYPNLNLPESLELRDVRMIPSSLRYFQRLE